MRRLLALVMVVGATAMVASAGPKRGGKEVGAGWRQGA